MRTRATWWVVLLAVTLVSHEVAAQGRDELGAAFALERAGRYDEAAREYRRVLAERPATPLALFGLERVLEQQGRLRELLPLLDSAIAHRPDDRTIRALQLRVLGSLGDEPSLDRAAEAWLRRDPDAPDPYREWAFALAQRGNPLKARLILERGHQRLGGGALLQELAQIAVVAGDWIGATRYWYAATAADPDLGAAAAMALTQAPPHARGGIEDVLLLEYDDAVARRLAADVFVVWNRPGEAWTLLDANLPDDPRRAADLLRRFADRARVVGTREHHRVRGFALERVARLVGGIAAQQARIDAARAFADAGERRAAERMLEQIAADPAAAPASAMAAMATLIAVEADAGRVADAERRLGEWEDRLPAEDVTALRERIAWAWIRRGELHRAERAAAGDSTLGTVAVLGWIALYRGDLAGATGRFREAGPYTGTRSQATDRTAMLALMQRVRGDSVPALGRALLLLARGDTSAAVDGLARAARQLPVDGGRADVLVLAGRMAAATRDERAPQLFKAALAADTAGPAAPAAELALAELAVRAGRQREAVERLEHLILSHPESAVVPQARRLLDQVRGAIPRS